MSLNPDQNKLDLQVWCINQATTPHPLHLQKMIKPKVAGAAESILQLISFISMTKDREVAFPQQQWVAVSDTRCAYSIHTRLVGSCNDFKSIVRPNKHKPYQSYSGV